MNRSTVGIPLDPHRRWPLLHLLWRLCPGPTAAAVATGLVASAAAITVIATVNTALHESGRHGQLFAWFAASATAAIGCRWFSTISQARASRDIITAIRIGLCRKIVSTPLATLERKGPSNVLTLLLNDVQTLAETLMLLPTLLVTFAIVAFGVSYIGLLSLPALGLTAACMLLGLLAYGLLGARGHEHLRRYRDDIGVFNGHVHGLIFGIKELQLNGDRRRWFMNAAFGSSAEKAASSNWLASVHFLAGEHLGHLAYFVLLCGLAFGASTYFSVEPTVVSACVLIVVSILEPLNTLVYAAPKLAGAAIAYRRIAEQGVVIEPVDGNASHEARSAGRGAQRDWNRIELSDVVCQYRSCDGSGGFRLGPINLGVRRGELLFIVGANGSGKSTLGKVLAGLYAPSSGAVRVNGHSVTSESDWEDYRSMFSAVFLDFHVFEQLFPPTDSMRSLVRAETQLASLRMDRKVRIENATLSTTTELSSGERKRLALLAALVEDRPVYLFDEWAADQDPEFKTFFYEDVLPGLKRLGKAVVVITHDDRYFGVADRVVRIHEGRIAHA